MAKIKAGWIGFLRDRSDYWEMAEKTAEIGYQATESELDLLNGDIKENAKRLKDIGLRLLTIRAAKAQDLTEDVKGKIERAHIFGCDRVTAFFSTMTSSFNLDRDGTYDEMMRDIECINNAVEIYSKEGLTVCYHNHFQEFTVLHKNAPCFEHMLIQCDERLCFDLDVGWVTVAGLNPVTVLDRLAPRTAAIHLKDFHDISNPSSLTGFTALGTGIVDIQGVLKKADELKIQWAIVEQDKLRNLGLTETLTASYYQIKESGLVE